MNLNEAIQALSLQDKERLFSHLGQLIQEEKIFKEKEMVKKMEEIKMAVCTAMGLSVYDPKNRERQNVVARVITANILLRMGCTENSIGKIMKKDHSTIHLYRETMKTWLEFPGYYKQELTIWNQIKQAYETD